MSLEEVTCGARSGGGAPQLLGTVVHPSPPAPQRYLFGNVDVLEPLRGKLRVLVLVRLARHTRLDWAKVAPGKGAGLGAAHRSAGDGSAASGARPCAAASATGPPPHLKDLLRRQVWAKVWVVLKDELVLLVALRQRRLFVVDLRKTSVGKRWVHWRTMVKSRGPVSSAARWQRRKASDAVRGWRGGSAGCNVTWWVVAAAAAANRGPVVIAAGGVGARCSASVHVVSAQLHPHPHPPTPPEAATPPAFHGQRARGGTRVPRHQQTGTRPCPCHCPPLPACCKGAQWQTGGACEPQRGNMHWAAWVRAVAWSCDKCGRTLIFKENDSCVCFSPSPFPSFPRSLPPTWARPRR